jgi:hypothetical protein
MRAAIVAIALLVAMLIAAPAAADTESEVRALYGRFAAAQNARDLAAVERLMLDSPKFLWISDGMAVWGRPAVLQRMALFQTLEIWRVEPDLEHATYVPTGERSGFLHLPLTLVIGKADPGPERLRFLVEMVAVETAEGWRIAALLTTSEKTP